MMKLLGTDITEFIILYVQFGNIFSGPYVRCHLLVRNKYIDKAAGVSNRGRTSYFYIGIFLIKNTAR